MLKRARDPISTMQWLPDDTRVVRVENCTITRANPNAVNIPCHVTVTDPKADALCVFDDDLGTYRVRYWPNMGWVWD